mmetsp:Transcript_9181/g.28141  ORF Transcript_9181/g.28141 Transcript_9181/m.28141 type:complete len:270 (+) Transcript_9181:862-1671(+)
MRRLDLSLRRRRLSLSHGPVLPRHSGAVLEGPQSHRAHLGLDVTVDRDDAAPQPVPRGAPRSQRNTTTRQHRRRRRRGRGAVAAIARHDPESRRERDVLPLRHSFTAHFRVVAALSNLRRAPRLVLLAPLLRHRLRLHLRLHSHGSPARPQLHPQVRLPPPLETPRLPLLQHHHRRPLRLRHQNAHHAPRLLLPRRHRLRHLPLPALGLPRRPQPRHRRRGRRPLGTIGVVGVGWRRPPTSVFFDSWSIGRLGISTARQERLEPSFPLS